MNTMAMSWHIRTRNDGREPRYATTPKATAESTVKQTHSSYILTTSRHTRPRPGRRRYLLRTLTALQIFLCSIVVLSTLCEPAGATKLYDGRRKPRHGRLALQYPKFEYVEPELELFKPGDIVHDRRFPVVPVDNSIYKRQDAVDMGASSKGNDDPKTTGQRHLKFSSTSTASPAATTTASLSDSEPTSAPSTQPTGLVTAPGTTGSSLPRPFDSGLGNNYTQPNCPIFINNFLRNDTFISCHPFSLLLQVGGYSSMYRS